MKKVLLSLGLCVAGFFASSAFATLPGIMPYDADFVPPPGYVKVVDDIEAPELMVIVQQSPSTEAYDYSSIQEYTPPEHYILPSTALKNRLIGDDDENWQVQETGVFLNNPSERGDWLSDSFEVSDSIYDLIYTADGVHFTRAEATTAQIRLIYTGPSYEELTSFTGVMAYDSGFVVPPGYVKMLDDISDPHYMIIMQQYPGDESYDLEQMLSYGPPANYLIPSDDIRQIVVTSNGETTWVPEGENTLSNDGNRADWTSNPSDDTEGGYITLRVMNAGELGSHFINSDDSQGDERRIRLIYTGPSYVAPEPAGCVNYSGAEYLGSIVLNDNGTVIGCGEPAEGDEDLIPQGTDLDIAPGDRANRVDSFQHEWNGFTARLGFACDDCSMGMSGFNDDDEDEGVEMGIPLGFDINFYGTTYDRVFINSNGSVTFGEGSDDYDEPLTDILDGAPGVCVYCIDLRNSSNIDTLIEDDAWSLSGAEDRHSDFVYRGRTMFSGRVAFVATWINMTPFATDEDQNARSSFQIMFVDTSDENDDVGIIINYGSMRNENNQGYCTDEEDSAWEALQTGHDDEYEGPDECDEDTEAGHHHAAIGIGSETDEGVIYNPIVDDSGTVLNGLETSDLWDEGEFALNTLHLNSEIPGRFIFNMVDGSLPGSTLAIFGCMDPAANNYNSDANTADDCEYAVSHLIATGGNGTASISWNAPMTGETDNILWYEINYSPGDHTITGVSNEAFSYSLDSLTNGTEYTIEVCIIHGYYYEVYNNETEEYDYTPFEDSRACNSTTVTPTAPTSETPPSHTSFAGGGGGSSIASITSKDPIIVSTTTTESGTTTTPTKALSISPADVFNPDIPDGECYKRNENVHIIDSKTIVTSDEFKTALTFLNAYNMTMFTSIDSFEPFGLMTRQQAAKMFSNFAMNVLCRKPTTDTVKYTDIGKADPSLRQYITLAYQLGLMKGSDKKFRPTEFITKAELNAVLTRLILKSYLPEDQGLWYQTYNDVSTKLGIIKNGAGLDPVSRHDASLMLFRAYKNQAFSQDSSDDSYSITDRLNYIDLPAQIVAGQTVKIQVDIPGSDR